MMSREQLIEGVQEAMAAIMAAQATPESTPWLDVDLSMAQLKALIFLHRRGVVRVGEVAHTLSLSPNATTAILDRLDKEGFTQRRPDPSNRRAVLVELTDQGVEWIDELFSANFRDYLAMLERLSLPDLRALHQGVTALGAVFRERGDQRPTSVE